MRAALRGLTTRGRSFIAAGSALTASGLGFGERDLLRIGLFVLALPFIAVIMLVRTRYRVACTRVLEPDRVEAGRPSRIVLRLENLSRLPTGVLLVEDALPYVLGARPRFVLDRLEPQGRRDVSYNVRSDVRGRYAIGPLAIRLTDPFGFCELSRSFRSVDHLIVTPVVIPLPAVRLGGDRAGGGSSSSRAVAAAGEDDVATREYRYGDDLRRVHWRSTAHAGELMVRREEQPWQSRAALFLDTRTQAHRGDGPSSSFEWAVTAAASIGVDLARRQYGVRMVTDAGDELRGVGGVSHVGGGEFEIRLLESLAIMSQSRVVDLAPPLDSVTRGGEGVVIAVLGRLDPDDLAVLCRVRRGNTACVAVAMDTSGWSSLAPELRAEASERFSSSVAVLASAGWRVLPVPFGTSVAEVWPRANTAIRALGAAAPSSVAGR